MPAKCPLPLLTWLLAAGVLIVPATGGAQVSMPNQRKFTEEAADCMRYLLPVINGGKPVPLTREQILGVAQGRLLEVSNAATFCLAYAHLMVEEQKAYVSVPSNLATSADVGLVKDKVEGLHGTFEAALTTMAKTFQENFIKAQICAQSKDDELRKRACAEVLPNK